MKAGTPAAEQRKTPPQAAVPDYVRPPLKPHGRMFVFLCVVFAAWLIVLLVMFFTTVYPYRHSITTTQPLP
jgi:hypothetical protein